MNTNKLFQVTIKTNVFNEYESFHSGLDFLKRSGMRYTVLRPQRDPNTRVVLYSQEDMNFFLLCNDRWIQWPHEQARFAELLRISEQDCAGGL